MNKLEALQIVRKERSIFVFTCFNGKVKARFKFKQAIIQQIWDTKTFDEIKKHKSFFNPPISIN